MMYAVLKTGVVDLRLQVKDRSLDGQGVKKVGDLTQLNLMLNVK